MTGTVKENLDLAGLAADIDRRLGNEHADRQTICEDVAARLRQLANGARIAGQRDSHADNDDPAPAARAVLGGFWRAYGDFFSNNGPEPESIWAVRLAVRLRQLATSEVLAGALADAIIYRESGPDGPCTGCDESPAGLCADHAADLGKASAYLALGRELRIEVDW
jgi:hypothetical protein